MKKGHYLKWRVDSGHRSPAPVPRYGPQQDTQTATHKQQHIKQCYLGNLCHKFKQEICRNRRFQFKMLLRTTVKYDVKLMKYLQPIFMINTAVFCYRYNF